MSAVLPTLLGILLCLFFSPDNGADHLFMVSSGDPQVILLTNQEAINIGTTQNLDLLSKKLEMRRSQLLADVAWRPYVPIISFSSDYRRSDSELNSIDEKLGNRAAASWHSPIGTKIEASVQNENRIGDKNARHNPTAELSLRQDLLRHGWWSGASTDLEVAQIEALLQRELFRSQLNQFVVELDRSYWSLSLAQEDVAIKTRSRDRAKQQFEDTQENIRRGILSALEIYVVEENLVYFEQELSQAQENLVLAQQKLAELLQFDVNQQIVATDELVAPRLANESDVHQIERGLLNNADLLASKLLLKQQRIHLAFFENQELPTLNLGASLKLNAQGNRQNAWQEIQKAKQPEVQVDILLELPLDFGTDDSATERGQLAVEKSLLSLQAIEREVVFRIQNLIIQAKAQHKRINMAKRRLELAELKLQAENDKYRNGISTLADVVRFQRDLDQAMIAVQRARLNLIDNQNRLTAAQGILHQRLGIEVK